MKFKLVDGSFELIDKNMNGSKSNTIPVEFKPIGFFNNKTLSIAPVVVLTAGTNVAGAGIFWDTFITYIFPYMMDIAKVFCAIKIAQGFYREHRGGRESGTGFGSFVTYGKWYLLFALMPYFVQLIDELGQKMVNELSSGV